MHTYELIKAIFHGIDFYWKKFLVFLLLIFVVISGALIWKSQGESEAAIQFSQVPQYATESQRTVDITVTEKGKVIVDGKTDSKALRIQPGFYEVRLKILDNPGAYIGNATITMHLPGPVSKDDSEQLMYAVHGIGSFNYYMADPQTLVYTADNISSSSTLTVAAHLPKNILTPPLIKRIVFAVTNVPAKTYLGIAIVIPAITLLITLFMAVKRRKDQILSLNAKPIAEKPDEISPAVAGVLVDGQVGAREIAATLIDLANRGFIYITKNGKNFSFGIRKSLNLDDLKIAPFERKLLSKMFENLNYRSTKDDVEMRVGRHIFSRKIADAYLEIYEEATEKGYFIKDPVMIQRRWKYTGIGLFILGILGYVYSVFFAPDPKFTLIFWAGEMAAAAVIVKLSGLMPVRSNFGSFALAKWMAFRNYLKHKKPVESGENIKEKYINYLPYAIVFGVEVEWTKRFFDENFVKPDWYESGAPVSTLENFAGGLFPLISFVGSILDKSHEPTVE
ncbi:MAG: DUF2207 domain-containing protein [Candidatus Berkelbacteria bacterium]|nr:DUF2207 domain-containing protein [Candidatus Berkelbacteria bacterium]